MNSSDIIDNLHSQFLKEAENSPFLMADLAALEHYISESYSGRSLIELLQNADDAAAQSFYVYIGKNFAIFANNGREFTSKDLNSLCRSGSSTKKRKGNTIGFRGIGFKSVVNYSEKVHLISGDFSVTFSKKLTAMELPQLENIPLIRIPHKFSGHSYLDKINSLLNKGFKTIFIFELNNDSLLNELSVFDISCLLFLRHITTISVHGLIEQHFSTYRSAINADLYTIDILDSQDTKSSWLTFHDSDSDIAFKLINNSAVPLENAENVIHSFMPTKDKFCLPCKVNGDFSTDPSRTKVVIDDETRIASKDLSNAFAKLLQQLYAKCTDSYNIFHILSLLHINPLRNITPITINDLFLDDLKESISKKIHLKSLYIKPDWMDYETYSTLGMDIENYSVITNLSLLPIGEFFKKLGANEFSLLAALNLSANKIYPESIRMCIIKHCIESTRFTMDIFIKDGLLNAYLFPSVNNQIIQLKNNDGSKISPSFIEELAKSLPNKQDLHWFFKKLGIESETSLSVETDVPSIYKRDKQENSKNLNINSTPKIKKSMTRWRTMEQNVATFFENLSYVSSVKDVSFMNIGYDIEVITTQGEKLLVEVKTVTSIGDAISMTNNEYSLASQDGEHYLLAIASTTQDELRLCIIKNPIKSQEFSRRIVRWEWVCNMYNGEEYIISY